jgi:hypothetical protein
MPVLGAPSPGRRRERDTSRTRRELFSRDACVGCAGGATIEHMYGISGWLH